MKKFGIFVIPYVLFLTTYCHAQHSVADSSINIFMLTPSAAFQIPAGDLAKRFGDNANIGGSFVYKTRSNWVFGLDGFFIFGNNVKENNIFDSISTSLGYVLSTGGTYSNLNVYERGYQINAKVGKLFPIWHPPNQNSGLLITGAVGFLQHKIRIETPGNDTPQLEGNYLAGYDRRTNGIAFTEFFGYQYLNNKNVVNFFAGFEFVQAITKERSSYNFNTMSADNSTRFDALNGIRAGWILTFLKRKPKTVYYN